jgi:hypothetical protein
MAKNTTLVEVDLTIRCFGGEKKSSKGEAVVTENTGANKSEFRVTAHTFPKSVVNPLQKDCAALRGFFRGLGLNGRDGTIYVTQDKYSEIKRKLDEKWEAIDKRIKETWTEDQYNKMIEQQKNTLSGLFDDTKIDSLAHIHSSYGMELFPRKIDLSAIVKDPIDKAQLDGYKDRIEEGLGVLVDILRDFTTRIIDNMSMESSHFKCAFDTCEKIVKVARNMNIFNDSVIDDVINKIEKIFNGYSPEDFKKDAQARTSVIEKAKKILSDIENIVVNDELKNLFGSQEDIV